MTAFFSYYYTWWHHDFFYWTMSITPVHLLSWIMFRTTGLITPCFWLSYFLTYQHQHMTTFCWFWAHGRDVLGLWCGRSLFQCSLPGTCYSRYVQPLRPQKKAAPTHQIPNGCTEGNRLHVLSYVPSHRYGSWDLQILDWVVRRNLSSCAKLSKSRNWTGYDQKVKIILVSRSRT